MIDVLVCGRSLAALRAALDCAELGLKVLVVGGHSADTEASDAEPADLDLTDTQIADTQIAGTELSDTERLSDTAGGLAAMVADLIKPLATPFSDAAHQPATATAAASSAAAMRLRKVPAVSPLLRAKSGVWAEQNEPNVWGIPAVPLAATTIALLGMRAALRAQRDRIAPLLTIGKTHTIGRLVSKRIGRTALDTLVAPQLWERFGVAPDDIDVRIVAPGFNETLTRAGSLTTAVIAYSDRHASNEARVVPEGGWRAVVQMFEERLRFFDAEFDDSIVETADRREDGSWAVQLASGTEVSARAVVIDDSCFEAAPVLSEVFAELLPPAHRIHAEFDIDVIDEFEALPEAEPETQPGVPRETLTQLGEWTVRVDDSGRARVSGPRQFGAEHQTPVEIEAIVRDLLEQCGFRPRSDAKCSISLSAAPFVSITEREAAAEALTRVTSNNDSLLPVGAGLFGGDMSASVAAAHRGAIELRRRLLGISDE